MIWRISKFNQCDPFEFVAVKSNQDDFFSRLLKYAEEALAEVVAYRK
jgi:hypothetical protein